MDYIQVFCSAVAVPYFLWVAKCWWTTDREGLHFQRKVWFVFLCALVLDITYTYGVIEGSSAVLQTVQRAMHLNPGQVDTAPLTAEQQANNPLSGVLIPKWATFYLAVLWAEIGLAVTMPDRKRSDGQAEAKPDAGNSERPST